MVAFRRQQTSGSLGLFFYAGHGVQVKGENFLVPVGARIREEFEVKRQCLDVGQILDAMAESESKLKVVILDCCRDNPLARSWSRSSSRTGLAAMADVPEGTVIAFSTTPGKTAADGKGSNSPYTANLVAALRSRPAGGLELRDVFFEASRAVKRETGQVPWLNLEASLDRYFLWTSQSTALKTPAVARPDHTDLPPATIEPETLLLWPQGAPGALGETYADRPSIALWPAPPDKATGAAIIVCPGGGYSMLAMSHEGVDVARWLNTLGISAYVLKYRLAPRYRHPAPLSDAQRALRTVRAKSKEWGLDPGRIGILGFSAGGHLASTVATQLRATSATRSIRSVAGRTSPSSPTQ